MPISRNLLVLHIQDNLVSVWGFLVIYLYISTWKSFLNTVVKHGILGLSKLNGSFKTLANPLRLQMRLKEFKLTCLK